MFLLYMHDTYSPQVLRGEHSDNLRLAPISVFNLEEIRFVHLNHIN